ncbi:MAG: uracil-DNA glycosylase, partial [Deltaproteobacteria bacterium]|nr:uracil-DNA glycosylase [Deltaproteobacteria bacterium]
MAAEGDPREELLELVRSLNGRIRTDRELKRPLAYLNGRSVGAGTAGGNRTEGEISSDSGDAEGLESIRGELGDCRRCGLGRRRHSLVFGEGNPRAELVFVGEAPGADEDAQG